MYPWREACVRVHTYGGQRLVLGIDINLTSSFEAESLTRPGVHQFSYRAGQQPSRILRPLLTQGWVTGVRGAEDLNAGLGTCEASALHISPALNSNLTFVRWYSGP